MNSKFMRLLVFLAWVFALSCTSTPAVVSRPPLPEVHYALTQNVAWHEVEGGLFLSFAEYRTLEGNIIEYRREIAELRAQINYYRGIP